MINLLSSLTFRNCNSHAVYLEHQPVSSLSLTNLTVPLHISLTVPVAVTEYAMV